MRTRYPQLLTLLGRYLPFDWETEFNSVEEALDEALRDARRETLAGAALELDVILADQKTEDPDLFSEIGSAYYPPDEGITAQSWLERLRAEIGRVHARRQAHWVATMESELGKWVQSVIAALKDLATRPDAPILDIEWLLLRCQDTLVYEADWQMASAKQLVRDLSEHRERLGELPEHLLSPNFIDKRGV